jgi:hypothetical protein
VWVGVEVEKRISPLRFPPIADCAMDGAPELLIQAQEDKSNGKDNSRSLRDDNKSTGQTTPGRVLWLSIEF